MRHQDDYTNQAAPQLSYELFSFSENAVSSIQPQASHVHHVKGGCAPTFAAFGFNVTTGIFKYCDCFVLAIRAQQEPLLLR